VLLIFPTLLIVTFGVFSVVRLIPGDVATLMVSEQGYGADVEAVKHMLGLDKPWHEQYIKYMSNVLRGDLGTSLWSKRAVTEELSLRVPVSVELGILAIGVSLCIAIPIGVASAIRQDTWPDYLGRSLAIGGLSIPGFWIATIILVLPAAYFNWSPPMKYQPFLKDPLANLQLFILPAVIMGIAMSASVMRMTRAMMLEVLRQDYIRTAWAKGMRERAVIVRHALKNAMIPVVTILGMQLSLLLGGTVIMESIFNLPGMGRLLIDAINWRDYPVVQGVNLVIATAIVCMNLLVDVTYTYLDPRIRYR
jgi:peptide/nickel transport system permease protein